MRHARNLLVLLAGVPLFAQTPPSLIDNDQVRVFTGLDRAHVKSAVHSHPLNRVMIYLTTGRQEFTVGGQTTTLEYKAGDALWSPAVANHVSHVLSDADVHIIEMEIKKPGDPHKMASPTLDPAKVDPKHYHLEFENSQVRVVRVKIPPHDDIPLHEHLLNRAVVYLTDQHGSQTTPDGKTEVAQHKAGEVSWGTPVKHSEKSLSDKPVETLIVEFKD